MNYSGKCATVDQKLSVGNNILTTITFNYKFQVCDLDLQAVDGVGDGTEKNFGPIPIIRPCMNPIHPRVWK